MIEKALLAALGAAIRARRKRAGLTISQLAELAGIDGGFLAYIETAKRTPSIATAAKIASALEIPLAELFQDAPRSGAGLEYEIDRQLHSLFHDKTPTQKTELLSLLKRLRNPDKVRALRQLM